VLRVVASMNLSASQLQRQADLLRIDILEMLCEARSGHPGGSLSCIDLITALYFSELQVRPQDPHWEDRDRFVISKGHGVPAVYAAMAARGFFDPAELKTLRKTGSRLQGHPDRARLPGIEASTGSLGQGLSVAQGMALASALGGKQWHTYCLLGDGECQEGQVWEAAMSAGKFRLGGRLTAILDYNRGQIDGPVKDVMDLEPLTDKWRAFNWDVQVIDGHDMSAILEALIRARRTTGKPQMIIANTVKGKGVSFMEGKIEWHGVAPTREQTQAAIQEIRRKIP
jgi:transketolase